MVPARRRSGGLPRSHARKGAMAAALAASFIDWLTAESAANP